MTGRDSYYGHHCLLALVTMAYGTKSVCLMQATTRRGTRHDGMSTHSATTALIWCCTVLVNRCPNHGCSCHMPGSVVGIVFNTQSTGCLRDAACTRMCATAEFRVKAVYCRA